MANNQTQTKAPDRPDSPEASESVNANVISVRQSSWITASTIIGVGVLTLPRSTAQYAKESGWIAAMVGALLAMAATAIITALGRRFQGQALASYVSTLMCGKRNRMIGGVFCFLLLIPFVFYWGISTALVARIFGEVVITTVLPKTPLEVIIGSMLIVSLLLVLYEVEVLARVNEILLPIIVVPILLIALSSYQSAKWENIFPIFDVDFVSFLKGVLASTTSFLGFEVLFIFSSYTQASGKMMKANLLGVAIPGFIYTLIVISGLFVFGVDELQLLAWPTLELVKTTEVPGLILERLESAFLGVWVAAVFTTVGNLYYANSLLIKQLLRLKRHRIIAFLQLPLLYYLSLQPPNIQKLFDYASLISMFGLIISIVIPGLLLVIAMLRKMRGNNAA